MQKNNNHNLKYRKATFKLLIPDSLWYPIIILLIS